MHPRYIRSGGFADKSIEKKNAIARRFFFFFSFFFFFFFFSSFRRAMGTNFTKGRRRACSFASLEYFEREECFLLLFSFFFFPWTTGRPIECLSSFAIRVETVARLLRITVFRTSRVVSSPYYTFFSCRDTSAERAEATEEGSEESSWGSNL